jgi:hypothetical protein
MVAGQFRDVAPGQSTLSIIINITIEEATTNLLDLLNRANKGEEITILKDG